MDRSLCELIYQNSLQVSAQGVVHNCQNVLKCTNHTIGGEVGDFRMLKIKTVVAWYLLLLVQISHNKQPFSVLFENVN